MIVRFRSQNARSKTVTAAVKGAKSFSLTPAAALDVSRDDLAELSRDPGCLRIWPDVQMHSCLDQSVPIIGAPRVWSAGYTGSGITVAVIDTGVDVKHPDLKDRIMSTYDATGDGFSDVNGHGTHVCGIVAGGGSTYRGVAPGARLVVVKVLTRTGFGNMSWVIDGLEWAVAEGVQVVNMSLGSSGSSDGRDPLSETCDVVVAGGRVICAAAGNDGPRSGSIGSPGAARRVITVGASTDSDKIADFSSRGPTVDGRTKPDVLFPGYGIISARAAGSSMGQVVDERYTQASGTSMASPHAAGAAATMLQANPRLIPGDIKALLMGTAKNLGEPQNVQGKGRARLDVAFGRDPTTVPHPDPEEAPSRPGRDENAIFRPMGCLALHARLKRNRR